MESFQTRFFDKVIGVYQLFGVAPRRKEQTKENLKRNLVRKWFPVVLFLGCYWSSLIICLTIKETKPDLISLVSNYIQMLTNAFALSVVLISTVSNAPDYYGILSGFDCIDHQFREFGIAVSYKKSLKLFYMSITVFCLALIAHNLYEIYTYIYRYEMFSVPYWIVHAIPFTIYGMCLHQAIFIIFCICIRCRMVNDLLKKRGMTNKICLPPPHPSIILAVRPKSDSSTASGNEDTIRVVYELTNEIHDLCERVNGYFGLSFLASFIALFAITSIQAFYCYTISSDFKEEYKRSLWTLFGSISAVVLNSTMVAILAYVSDTVTTEALNINANVRKLKEEQTMQYSSWLHPVLINIKISAFGFFHINCTMLCGFFSALVTYLLILVQCNEIAGDKKDSSVSYSADYSKVSNPSSEISNSPPLPPIMLDPGFGR